MARNHNYQTTAELAPSVASSTNDFLRAQQKDIVCSDCGGISATKVQQLLANQHGPALIRPKSIKRKRTPARNNSRKTSQRRVVKQKKKQAAKAKPKKRPPTRK